MYKKTIPSLIVWLLFLLIATPGAAQTEDDFLQPDDAYRISAIADGPNAVIIQWKVADGYYLYQNKFKFIADEGITLGDPDYPPAKQKRDEFFGDVEIYRNKVSIRLPIKSRPEGLESLQLTTLSQGCADAGLCYPPHTQQVTIKLPPISSGKTTSSSGSSALSALSNLSLNLGMGDEQEILSPEEAYQFSYSLENPNNLLLKWQIADGTYLYQDKISAKIIQGDGITLGALQLPKPKVKRDALRPDRTTGDLPVYYHQLEIPLPLIRSSSETSDLELQIKYQGCAEAGVCYPPQKQSLKLALPETTQLLAGTTQAETQLPLVGNKALPQEIPTQAPATEQDKLTAILSGGNLWLIIAGFFVAGLLLAFTPCVFPMIPILSGIIAGQGEKITTSKAFTLSLVYVLAMAVTYTVAGVLAGLFGGNLQATFQNPWILSTFAGVFVLLALSMFGFYELQLPSSWQSKLTDSSNRQKGGSLTGVAIMGLLSALIVGPCVAPPLVGALVFIGQTGDAVLGGMALFALAMGMGAPVLIIGTSAGKLLPRAGSWMDTVKTVFGVTMLAVAIILLERIVPAEVAMLLWGMLLISSAIYMGAIQQLKVEASGWDRLWKGLGIVLLVYGSLMLVGVAIGGKDTIQPLRGIFFSGAGDSTASTHLQFKRIKTVADLQREVEAASASGKPVMLDFVADWCVSCKEFERYTFSDSKVISALSDFILLQADITDDDEDDRALLQGHFGMPGPPTIIFYDRAGQERKNHRVVGFMGADEFTAHIQKTVP
ncbi:MAG: protein-disulfide reductase DsbD [Gammaproteobacteria bacterium]|nr:protein-disulfide reductase DsbD [Gammaproteobacteria bacterium]